jgi:hypothetical protein
MRGLVAFNDQQFGVGPLGVALERWQGEGGEQEQVRPAHHDDVVRRPRDFVSVISVMADDGSSHKRHGCGEGKPREHSGNI